MSGHDHASGHSHGRHAPHRVLILCILIIFAFAIVEAFGGVFAKSLALLGDAGHMGSDALALMIAAFAAWISDRPPSHKHSFGLGRAEVVAAWISSFLMLLISIAVIVEAIARINHPTPVKGLVVMIIAFFGLCVNLLVAWLLAKGERTINIRAAMLHVMGDLLGSIAALVSGTVIYYTHWFPIDPILSIVIGILILISSLRLLHESLLILMDTVPKHIDYHAVETDMSRVSSVNAVHDLHIWTLSSGKTSLSAHIDIAQMSDWAVVLPALHDLLDRQYDIQHVTLQPEPEMMNCNPCSSR